MSEIGFQVGPYQYKFKHLDRYMEVYTKGLAAIRSIDTGLPLGVLLKHSTKMLSG